MCKTILVIPKQGAESPLNTQTESHGEKASSREAQLQTHLLAEDKKQTLHSSKG